MLEIDPATFVFIQLVASCALGGAGYQPTCGLASIESCKASVSKTSVAYLESLRCTIEDLTPDRCFVDVELPLSLTTFLTTLLAL